MANGSPPIYPVSENTNPNVTLNPTFELAYWRFGLDIAIKWKERQRKAVPREWAKVRDELAPLPVANETYPIYEGIPNMWIDNTTTSDVSNVGLPCRCLYLSCLISTHHIASSNGWHIRVASTSHERTTTEHDDVTEHCR